MSPSHSARISQPLLLALLLSFLRLVSADECQPHQWGRLAAPPEPELGELVCRSNGTTGAVVNYYSCKQMADYYELSIEYFFMINPVLDEDCSNIEPYTDYCISGYKQPLVSTDGKCGPPNKNALCSGTGKPCCNSETWTCGDTDADCAPGTCHAGACEGADRWSLDGNCGWRHGGVGCAGKWGDCCSLEGKCGTGEDFCGIGKCDTGNCTQPELPPAADPPAPSNDSLDGTCGGSNGWQCDVIWGYCCGADGKCGMGTEFCGAGCQPEFGRCGTATATTTARVIPTGN
ncbi:hypothetical protein CMUS01_09576 [Colletotrichum musicola]|uniref:Chitin-binding type-1 domain-containing protein n=1 Tax=Colletotrichum musicola TaxID=2175873 RepID=A0A8H6NAX3_9PEZI|nr:hypothetical protein CMUS01_09576 [Colletotrichum musicola]